MKFLERFLKQYSMSQETQSLHDRIRILEEKYEALLEDIKNLEESNIETDNVLYELTCDIQAVDTRIDIMGMEKWLKED